VLSIDIGDVAPSVNMTCTCIDEDPFEVTSADVI